MAAIAVVLGLCCCSSFSAAGGWFGGFIPGTEPNFLKAMNATEWKEIIDELKVMTEKRNEETKEFEKGGPDGADLSAEERQEMMNVMKNHMQELRDSDTCKKIKELIDTRENNKYKKTMSDYPDDIITLSGSKRKQDVFESAVGIDDDFPKREFDGAVEVCMVTDEKFQELIER
tara:strand:- start:2656 stop:3177 length:522 start_codon:yes stop_codon:yes gene_type:complete